MGIDLNASQATHAGALLSASAEGIARARATIGGRIESAGQQRPWGGDDLGTAFAKNYVEPATRILEVWRAAASRTAQLGTEIVTAVESTVATDDAASWRLETL